MKTHKIKEFRISPETDALFREAKEGLGIKSPELCRLCFNTALKKLKADSIQAGGFDKLPLIVKDLN